MKTLMIAAALCAGVMSAQAQSTADPKTAPTNTSTTTKPVTTQDHKDCLRTTEADWKALGLTADQMTKVKNIQAEHEKACAGMKKDDASKAQMTDKHETRIKEVLTPTQYDSWMKQCTAMAEPVKPMEKK